MTPERRAVISIVAAVSVLVIVTVAILVFGVIPLPDFPSLADQPDPSIPGTVAYVEYDETPCLFTVPASGGAGREAWCGREYVEFPAWTSDGLLVVTDWAGAPTYVLIDPTTGTEVDQVPAADGVDAGPPAYPGVEKQKRADGATVHTEGIRGGESAVIVRLSSGEDQTILSVEKGKYTPSVALALCLARLVELGDAPEELLALIEERYVYLGRIEFADIYQLAATP